MKKIDILRNLMIAGEWEKAIKMAAKFPRLGNGKEAIQRAAGCINNPGFFEQLGHDITECIAAGRKAIEDDYGV